MDAIAKLLLVRMEFPAPDPPTDDDDVTDVKDDNNCAESRR